MKDVLKNTDIAVITTGKVIKSYDNEDCFLYSVIIPIKDDIVNKERTYKAKTDLVAYREIEVIEKNDEGEDVILEREQLTFVESRQDWSIQVFSYDQIDSFVASMADQLPEDLTRTQKDITELQVIFLAKRQQAAPWGIGADKWRVCTDEDLLRSKD